jgi:sodium/bile acid cotransporter 7
MKLPINGFLLGLIVSIGAAWVFPEIGAHGGLLKSEITTKLGVLAIFFLQGVLLPTEKLKNDILEWQLHLFVQIFNFIIVPLLAYALVTIFAEYIKPELRIGILFLSILPTTISTAVLFSSLAGGNVGGAIFNTSLSNILGVFIVPTWSAWLLFSATGQSIPLGPLLAKIAILILLPMIVGQSLRPFLKNLAQSHKKGIGRFNMGMIFYMLYVAFCGSVKNGVWKEQGMSIVFSAMIISVILLLIVKSLAFGGVKLFKFNHSIAITAFFCASQKTLAAGVPMATSIFTAVNSSENAPELGLVLLPLMCYHPLQILIGGFIIARIKED